MKRFYYCLFVVTLSIAGISLVSSQVSAKESASELAVQSSVFTSIKDTPWQSVYIGKYAQEDKGGDKFQSVFANYWNGKDLKTSFKKSKGTFKERVDFQLNGKTVVLVMVYQHVTEVEYTPVNGGAKQTYWLTSSKNANAKISTAGKMPSNQSIVDTNWVKLTAIFTPSTSGNEIERVFKFEPTGKGLYMEQASTCRAFCSDAKTAWRSDKLRAAGAHFANLTKAIYGAAEAKPLAPFEGSGGSAFTGVKLSGKSDSKQAHYKEFKFEDSNGNKVYFIRQSDGAVKLSRSIKNGAKQFFGELSNGFGDLDQIEQIMNMLIKEEKVTLASGASS